MNVVYFALVLVAVVAGAATGTLGAVGDAALTGAQKGVEVALSLAGAMALFLGLLHVLDKAGGVRALARLVRPIMVRLFPEIPPDHPAIGAMTLNIAANILGLGNAATPFGIKAMQELATLSRTPGVATDAMVLFLAINTSGVAVFPKDVVAIRVAAGAADPASVVAPTLVASLVNTVVAVVAARGFARLWRARGWGEPAALGGMPEAPPPAGVPSAEAGATSTLELTALPLAPGGLGASLAALAALGGGVAAVIGLGARVSDALIPILILGVLAIGLARGVRVYEAVVEGAREGLTTTLRVLPYLVAILSAIGMLRASTALDRLVDLLRPAATFVGIPAEVIPLALLRPLSGSGALGLVTELTDHLGPDSFAAQVAGTMMGTTETTFYVLAVYFGAVQVTRARHAVLTGVVTDLAGVAAAVAACHWLLGG